MVWLFRPSPDIASAKFKLNLSNYQIWSEMVWHCRQWSESGKGGSCRVLTKSLWSELARNGLHCQWNWSEILGIVAMVEIKPRPSPGKRSFFQIKIGLFFPVRKLCRQVRKLGFKHPESWGTIEHRVAHPVRLNLFLYETTWHWRKRCLGNTLP